MPRINSYETENSNETDLGNRSLKIWGGGRGGVIT